MGLTARQLVDMLADELDEYPEWDPELLVDGEPVIDLVIDDDVVGLVVERDA